MNAHPADVSVLGTVMLMGPSELPEIYDTDHSVRSLAQRIAMAGLSCRLAVWIHGDQVLIGVLAYPAVETDPSAEDVLQVYRHLEARSSEAELSPFSESRK